MHSWVRVCFALSCPALRIRLRALLNDDGSSKHTAVRAMWQQAFKQHPLWATLLELATADDLKPSAYEWLIPAIPMTSALIWDTLL